MNVNTSNKWIKAIWDPSAGIQTTKPCITLGDIYGKNDHRLILIDESQVPCRLKLLKGLNSAAESVLLEAPAGISTFVSGSAQNETHCLAVACGHGLLIYRNMKPYYRYNVPQMDLLQDEANLWQQVMDGLITKDVFNDALKNVQLEHGMAKLSTQSQQLLTLDDETKEPFIDHVILKSSKDGKIILHNMQMTCISTMRRNQSKDSSVDVLVAGTEQNSVYFIDSQAYKVLRHTVIGATPVKILADVFVLRQNQKGEFSTSTLHIRELAFDVIMCSGQLVFATRKNRLVFYNLKGKRQNSIQLDEQIVDIERFYYEPRQYDGILVVQGAEVHLYMGDQLRSDIKMDRPIEWIKFGKMDHEDGVLIIGVLGGGVCVKIFRRVAIIDDKQVIKKKSVVHKPIEISKKSKTFVDQSLRERENPRLLHQIYQRDWFMVKYHVAKTYSVLESAKTHLLPTSKFEPIQINYDVLGFGPKFRLIVRMTTTENLDEKQRWLLFLYNAEEYAFSSRILFVPKLIPNNWARFAVEITCLHPEKQLNEESVRIILTRSDWSRPVWATAFQMPLSEQNDVVG